MDTAKAGWAEIETTPPLGLPMGGRGPRFAPGTLVLDPLVAQALVLEDTSGRQTLWISVDMIGMTFNATYAIRHEVSTVTGIPVESVIVNFSHTHSGPMSGFEGYATERPKPSELQAYENDVATKITRIACRALDNLQPATVTLHTGQSNLGINRRNRNEAGEMGMAPNPDGVYNPDLWVLDVTAQSGRCVVFNYGCHPVIVYGFSWDGISADYPGVCRNRLRETLGADVHCQFIQGCAGNVRPRLLADLAAGRFRKSTPKDPIAAGTDLAEDITRTLATPGTPLALNIAAASGYFQAPKDQARIPGPEHWQTLAESEDELNQNLGQYWANRLRAGIPPARAVPWAIGLLRLAPACTIAWMAGEVLAEWMGHLRSWLNDGTLVVWGYCQDGRGYLPTDELIPEGGYEVDRSNTYNRMGPGPFAPGLNEAARKGFLALRTQLDAP